MATTILVSCPECKKQIKLPVEVRGKTIRCKSCGHAFKLPTAQAAKENPAARPVQAAAPKPAASAKPEKAPPAAAPVQDDDDDEVGTYAVTDLDAPIRAEPSKKQEPEATPKGNQREFTDDKPYELGDVVSVVPRCPQCATEMESEESIICLKCGYNTMTRSMGKMIRSVAHTNYEIFVWWSPGIGAAVVALALALFIAFLWLGANKMAERDPESTIYWICSSFPMQVWGSVIAAFIAYIGGLIAYKRLVKNPWPPEKLKT